MLDVTAYLNRIGYAGRIEPTAETLRQIHLAHMLSVPFENLDIGLGRGIVCDQARFVRKVVTLRRGGFCYELNGAFAALLTALRFKVTLLSARVSRADGSASPEFDHLALRVHLEEPWLADVGFGDCFLEPLLLRPGLEQTQGEYTYRIRETESGYLLQRRRPAEDWNAQYAFTLTPRSLDDFAPMCRYHQTSPESHFTQRRVCSIAKATGRVTLADSTLTVTEHGIRRETALGSEQEVQRALQQYFGIVL